MTKLVQEKGKTIKSKKRRSTYKLLSREKEREEKRELQRWSSLGNRVVRRSLHNSKRKKIKGEDQKGSRTRLWAHRQQPPKKGSGGGGKIRTRIVVEGAADQEKPKTLEIERTFPSEEKGRAAGQAARKSPNKPGSTKNGKKDDKGSFPPELSAGGAEGKTAEYGERYGRDLVRGTPVEEPREKDRQTGVMRKKTSKGGGGGGRHRHLWTGNKTRAQ